MNGDLKGRMVGVLTSAETYQIDFKFYNNIRVESTGFSELLAALWSQDGVDIKVDPAFLKKSKAGAAYNKSDNTFYFQDYRYGTWPVERALILHECVHAVQDLRRAGPQTYFQEEAAAYIAELLHLRYATGTTGAASIANMDALYATADEIAGKFVGRKGAVVDLPDVTRLISEIRRSPTYSGIKLNEPAANDG